MNIIITWAIYNQSKTKMFKQIMKEISILNLEEIRNTKNKLNSNV